jgi:transglutaminase-like putative cysteine protease
MDYRITHTTSYEYAQSVAVSHHATRFQPLESGTQWVSSFDLQISPRPSLTRTRTDYFGNRVCTFTIQEIHDRLDVTARSHVTVFAPKPVVLDLSEPWMKVHGRFRDPVSPEDVPPYEFCLDSPQIITALHLADYARESFPGETPFLVGVRDLTRRIFHDFKYDPRATTVATPFHEVWEKRRGVCQDFAHVAISCLRSLGLPARYISGYLRTRPPAGQPRLIGADASHAWFAVYCPQTGWVDFDPTNDLLPMDEHITIAVGRDFSDVSPLSGVLSGGGEHEVDVSVDVEPLN